MWQQFTVALFFDTYERTGLLLDAWLRNLYAGRYGDLPETLITTISGQNPLDPNLWSEYLPVVADIPLEPFSEAEARQFLASKAITDEPTIKEIIRLSGRLPLWLATLADSRMQGNADIGDPSGNAVERFLKWEADPARREVAMAAALPRILNQDVLAVVSPTAGTRDLFDWLRRLPFVTQQGEFWVYHDVVRAAMLRLRRAEAPAEWRAGQNKLAQANATLASEAAAGTADAWANADWVDYRREEIYHSLCADAHRTLPQALASAVKAAGQSTIRARQWAAIIADAGRDTGNERLKEWGRRLEECIHGDDRIPYLTCLINDAALDKANLVVAYKERGGQYHDVRRYADALADYSRAIELNPESARTIASHGDMLRHLLRYEEAVADYTRAIEINPESAGFRAGRAASYQSMDRYADALTDYNQAIELNPRSARTIANRGYVFRQLRRYGEALSDFSRAIEISPESGWIIAGRGDVYHDIGRYDDAFSDFTRAIEFNPKDVHALTDRGDIHNHLGRYREGVADLTRAIELDPENVRAMSMRGESYRMLERYDDALADFNRTIELAPTYARAIGNRGQTHQAMGQYDDAIADLTRATELAPDQAWIVAVRGETYRLIGRYDDALADLNRAIELDPTYVWAIGERGQTHLAMGQYEDAPKDITRMLELNANPEAESENRPAAPDYVPMAVSMLTLGHRKEAAAIFETASKLSPSDPDALNNWAFCLMPDSPDMALQLLDQAAQIYQKDRLILIANRLRCLLQLDRQSAALAVAERVIGALSSYPCEFAYLWSLDGFTLEEIDDVRQYIIDCASWVIDSVSDRDVFLQWNAVLTEARAAVSSE